MTGDEARALVKNPAYNHVDGWRLDVEEMVGSIFYYKGNIAIYCCPGAIAKELGDGTEDENTVYLDVMAASEGEILHQNTAKFDGTAAGWLNAVRPYLRAWDADARLGR